MIIESKINHANVKYMEAIYLLYQPKISSSLKFNDLKLIFNSHSLNEAKLTSIKEIKIERTKKNQLKIK
jgi:hypothetical protein